jgi:hypothetical protein
LFLLAGYPGYTAVPYSLHSVPTQKSKRVRRFLTLNMLIAVWDSCALTLFTHKFSTIILITNIGGMEVDTGQ